MCAFCDIVHGRTHADVVFEDAVSIGFLDHRPLFPGHTLLAPRAHFETVVDLPPDIVGPFFAAAQVVTAAVQKAVASQGTFVAINNVVSQSVPHLHVHIVPRNRKDGLRGFFWPRRHYADDDQRRATADAIRAALQEVGA